MASEYLALTESAEQRGSRETLTAQAPDGPARLGAAPSAWGGAGLAGAQDSVARGATSAVLKGAEARAAPLNRLRLLASGRPLASCLRGRDGGIWPQACG